MSAEDVEAVLIEHGDYGQTAPDCWACTCGQWLSDDRRAAEGAHRAHVAEQIAALQQSEVARLTAALAEAERACGGHVGRKYAREMKRRWMGESKRADAAATALDQIEVLADRETDEWDAVERLARIRALFDQDGA